jgi:sodium/bile acid cotransporter 7
MIFHQLQLFVCAALAGRFRREVELANAMVAPVATLPRTESEIAAMAAMRNLTIPEACMPGVVANLALLDRHAATLAGTGQ